MTVNSITFVLLSGLFLFSSCSGSPQARATSTPKVGTAPPRAVPEPPRPGANNSGGSAGGGGGGSGGGQVVIPGPGVVGAGNRGRFASGDFDPERPQVFEPGPGGRPAKLSFKRDLPASIENYPGYDEAKMVTRNVAYASDSVEHGAKLYQASCVMCHGPDGAGPEKPAFNTRVDPRNLSKPMEYRYGASDQAIWRSITYGIPGGPMGGFEKSYSQSQIWDLVNYLQSIEKKEAAF